jgi:hypothetical protein
LFTHALAVSHAPAVHVPQLATVRATPQLSN